MAGKTGKPSLAEAMVKVKASAGRQLRTDIVLQSLDDEGRALLSSWLHDGNYTSGMIATALAAHSTDTGVDYAVSASAIDTWRDKNGIG